MPILSWVVPFLLYTSPDLIREFFIANYFGRFIAGYPIHEGPTYFYPEAGHGITEVAHAGYPSHGGPIYFYLLQIWPEFAPGSIVLPLAIWMAWKTRKEWENRAGIFFLFVAPLALLSVSVAKSPVYFLPLHPALAMLVAWSIAKGWTSPGQGAKILASIIATAAILVAGGMVGMTGIRGGSALSVSTAGTVLVLAAVGCVLSMRRIALRWTAAWVAVLISLAWSLWFTGPMAEADVARRSIHRPMVEVFGRVGNRNIVLYHPPDGLPGAVSFYRNRTAQEIMSPATLLARLTEDQNEVVALVHWMDEDAVPPELDKAAQAAGADLQIEGHYNLGKRSLLLVSAKPAGQ